MVAICEDNPSKFSRLFGQACAPRGQFIAKTRYCQRPTTINAINLLNASEPLVAIKNA